MTDDRTAWRYYAGAALSGFIRRYNHVGLAANEACTIADKMLAAEKERFKPVTPHPLAVTANDGE